MRNTEKHPLKKPCNCKQKCFEKILADRRILIHKQYWEFTRKDQEAFVFSSCEKRQKKRVMAKDDGSRSRKTYTFHYRLTDENDVAHPVCKVFYLSTLGYDYKNESIITNVVGRTPLGAISPNTDLRGRHVKFQFDREAIVKHIESYNPTVSHYRREHAPNVRYLPSDIRIGDMHQNLLQNSEINCSYSLYQQTVKSLKIRFTNLGHEECEMCEHFKIHDNNHTRESLVDSCETCKIWATHIKSAERARDRYRFYADFVPVPDHKEMLIVSVDLQKVIMLPRMEGFKSVIFAKRLTAYNESFVVVGNNQKFTPYAAVWHEAIGGRSKSEIISCFNEFLNEVRDYKKVVLFLDNCAAQNKNWAFFSFLVSKINSNDTPLVEIELNYFEPGHTFMSADSFHHCVEVQLRKAKRCYDFQDFVNCVRAASKNTLVKTMQFNDFRKWDDHCSKCLLKNKKHNSEYPYLQHISKVSTVRGSYLLRYEKDWDGEEKTMNFLKQTIMKKGFPVAMSKNSPDGISIEKKDELIKVLKPILPDDRLKFWNELPVTYTD